MTSYIKVENDRYNCENCPTWLRTSCICPTTALLEVWDNPVITCPLLKPFNIEELETPLSHIKYEKIIIRECDQDDGSN